MRHQVRAGRAEDVPQVQDGFWVGDDHGNGGTVVVGPDQTFLSESQDSSSSNSNSIRGPTRRERKHERRNAQRAISRPSPIEAEVRALHQGRVAGSAASLPIGLVEGVPVSILVDSGATVSLMDTALATQLQLPVNKCKTAVLRVVGGSQYQTGGLVVAQVDFDGKIQWTEFFTIPTLVSGSDCQVLLGDNWARADPVNEPRGRAIARKEDERLTLASEPARVAALIVDEQGRGRTDPLLAPAFIAPEGTQPIVPGDKHAFLLNPPEVIRAQWPTGAPDRAHYYAGVKSTQRARQDLFPTPFASNVPEYQVRLHPKYTVISRAGHTIRHEHRADVERILTTKMAHSATPRTLSWQIWSTFRPRSQGRTAASRSTAAHCRPP